jgi:exopolysaccharide production protein ExoQ
MLASTTHFQSLTTVRGRRVPLRNRMLVWLLMIPVVYFAVQGLFSFFEMGGDARGFLGKVIIPGVAYSIVLCAVLSQLRNVLRLLLEMRWFAVLALVTILSALWSQDPLRSATTGFLYLLDTLFAFYICARFDPEQQMTFFMIGGATVAGLGLLVIAMFPQFGLDDTARTPGAWRGIFSTRTGNALMMSFLISPALVLGRKAFNYRRFLFLILLSTIILKAQVASAILVLTAFCIFLLILRHSYRIRSRSLGALTLVGLPVIAVAVSFGSFYLPSIFKALGRDPTLTGRTAIWASLSRSVAKQPLLGYGYHAFWLGLNGESAHAILASHWVFGYAHNGVLEVILQIGFVGLALFLVTFAQALRNAWTCYRRDRSPETEWYMSILVLTILYNISEETLLWPSSLLSILYIVACTGLANTAKRLRAEKSDDLLSKTRKTAVRLGKEKMSDLSLAG